MAADLTPIRVLYPHGAGIDRLAVAVELRCNVSEKAAAAAAQKEDHGIVGAVAVKVAVKPEGYHESDGGRDRSPSPAGAS